MMKTTQRKERNPSRKDPWALITLLFLVLAALTALMWHYGWLASGKYERGRQAYFESFFVIGFRMDSNNLVLSLASNHAENLTILPQARLGDAVKTVKPLGNSSLQLFAGKRVTILIEGVVPNRPVGDWVEIRGLTLFYTPSSGGGEKTAPGLVYGRVETVG